MENPASHRIIISRNMFYAQHLLKYIGISFARPSKSKKKKMRCKKKKINAKWDTKHIVSCASLDKSYGLQLCSHMQKKRETNNNEEKKKSRN